MELLQTIIGNALWVAAGGFAALAAGKKYKKTSLTSAGTLAMTAGILMFLYGFMPGLGLGLGQAGAGGAAEGQEVQAEASVEQNNSFADSRMTDADMPSEEADDESQENAVSEDELRITVSEHSVYVDDDLCENEDDLTSLLEERYQDDMQVILIDDYAVSQDYRMVRDVLDELAIPYYETVLK